MGGLWLRILGGGVRHTSWSSIQGVVLTSKHCRTCCIHRGTYMANRRSEAGSAQKTETLEISAAQEELSILDKLANALSAIISDLTRQRPQFDRRNEHTEVALHERKYSSLKGYQELAHHCYGRTVIGKEVDERGRPTSQFSYRITQANVGHVDDGCVVLARNSPIASKLVTANPGDESEISLPKRMRFL